MKEMLVQSLVWEDPLEKKMVIHSSILAWKIRWTEEPGPQDCKELDTTEHAHMYYSTKTSFFKDINMKLSLVVQWLKIPPFNAGDVGPIPGQGTRISHAMEQLGPQATATKWPTAKTQLSQINKETL